MVNLPTNNFYAFIAVLGILAISGSIGLWVQAEKDIESHWGSFNEKAKEYNTLSFAYMTKANEALRLMREAGSYRSLSGKNKDKVDSIYDELDPLEMKITELKTERDMYVLIFTKRVDRYEYTKWTCIGGIVAGTLLFSVGSAGWYKRIQAPLDNTKPRGPATKKGLTRHSTRRSKRRGAG